MNSRNLIVGILILILLVGGAYVVFKRSQTADRSTAAPQTIATATPEASPLKKQVMINLTEEKGSSESGMAMLVEDNGKVVVTLEMSGAPAGVPQPAHIHVGKCPEVGAVKYPLTNVVDGKSNTTIDTTLDNLMTQLPLGINVHKSVSQSSVYVACGDITKI